MPRVVGLLVVWLLVKYVLYPKKTYFLHPLLFGTYVFITKSSADMVIRFYVGSEECSIELHQFIFILYRLSLDV